jgi:hypothetical protein
VGFRCGVRAAEIGEDTVQSDAPRGASLLERMLTAAATLESERGEDGPGHGEPVHELPDGEPGVEDRVCHGLILSRQGAVPNDLRHTPDQENR